MAKKSTILYIPMGVGLGKWKFAWRVVGDTLSGSKIRAALGIKKVNAQDPKGRDNLVFGANLPTPARVRINFEGGGSTESWCAVDKLRGVTEGNNLVNKTWDVEGKFKNRVINSVTQING